MNRLKKRLLYAGLEKEDFLRLIPQARLENEGKLKTYALIGTALFSALSLLNLIFRVFPLNTVICYAVTAVFNLGMYALARTVAPRRPAVVTALCYGFVAGLYAFSLAITCLHPELPAVAAIAVMLMGPFLFSERPLNLIVMNGGMIAVLCALSFLMKTREMALIDLWNAFSFGIISVAAELNQEKVRFQLLYHAEKTQYLSETDVLTGCKNRNCFQERQSAFPNLCEKEMVCVYADLNGLHNLNDSKGHDAGDEMLKAVARGLLDAFGTEHTYRVGGDEFVVLRPDGDPNEIREQVGAVVNQLAARGIDLSAGVASSPKEGLDVDSLVKQAEQSMYREKAAYYQQEGHDRRRR